MTVIPLFTTGERVGESGWDAVFHLLRRQRPAPPKPYFFYSRFLGSPSQYRFSFKILLSFYVVRGP